MLFPQLSVLGKCSATLLSNNSAPAMPTDKSPERDLLIEAHRSAAAARSAESAERAARKVYYASKAELTSAIYRAFPLPERRLPPRKNYHTEKKGENL